ncbi:MAG: aldo/keto reductase [Phycisphaerales bacterium]|nr:MAG: aldo/keto reductase [Phycisphaerales bacterium]
MKNGELSRRTFLKSSSLVAAGAIAGAMVDTSQAGTAAKTLCYNPDMEYRRLGKTNLMVSAVCLGGHWKRVNVMNQDFDRNRREVVDRCMELGVNYIDACVRAEVLAYCKALKGRRDKMYMALSYSAKEVRNPEYRTAARLLQGLDELMRESGQEYTDLWRITCLEPGGRHTFDTSCEIIEALEKARKQGKARFIGISSHDRRWLKMMIEQFPQLQVILFPYTSMSKVAPQDSLFDAVKRCDVGAFGIKPFAGNSLFEGDSSPGSPTAEQDNRRARLAIRYILCNPAITAPIPGLISTAQVDNMALAVRERRQLDVEERAELERASTQMWARLPADYHWLKNWRYV